MTAPVPKGTLTFGEEVSSVDRSSHFTQSGFSADNAVSQQTTIWSLFANYSMKAGNFTLSGGLRWQNERNNYEQNGQYSDEMSPNYSMLIPRLSVSYDKGGWKHTLSYQASRRNPPYNLLSSAVNYRSKYEYDTGNPFLKSTSTHDFNVTTSHKWLYAELFYAYIKNANRSFQMAYDDENHPGVMIMDYRNVPKLQQYGIKFNLSPKVGIWQMNYTAQFFFSDLDEASLGITHHWNGLITSFNLDNTLSLPNSWSFNVRADLSPYNETGCAQKKTTGGINLRLSRQFLKDKSLSVALLANDILKTRYTEMTAYGGINIRTHFREYYDSRRIGLDLSWKFNATRSRYKGSHAGQSERSRL